jgi:hypothetical protein
MSGFSAPRIVPITSTVLSAAAVTLATGTPSDVTSIPLPAGLWDLWATIDSAVGGTTDITQILGWISLTSATVPTIPNSGAFVGLNYPAASHIGFNDHFPVGRMSLLLAAPATVYLSARATFTVSTFKMYGFLGASPG